MLRWQDFPNGQNIVGVNLLDFIGWMDASDRALTGGSSPDNMPIIALPPVQRTAVWRPKQVLDLWDSLMRGLPIGMFYLVERLTGSRPAVLLGGQMTCVPACGFELLDGQQRARALFVGLRGPRKNEPRCIWVDLGAESASQRPNLRITSKAQPFGYHPETGRKLPLDERRRARLELEQRDVYDASAPNVHLLKCDDGAGGERPAYDLDLFDGPVTRNGQPIEQPPKPYGTTPRTFKFHKLFNTWHEHRSQGPKGGVEALTVVTGNARQEALLALDKAFNNVARAQIALLRINPSNLDDPNHDLLALFERIGAGGTPLFPEERLFSIYKYHVPAIRTAVNAIYDDAGRVLPPTKIAATALRIANARKRSPSDYVPNVAEFAHKMAETPRSELRRNLESLIPIDRNQQCSRAGLLHSSFVKIKTLLSYSDRAGPFWIPDILLVQLPAGVWQVLTFWASRRMGANGRPADLEPSRQEAVRFALFWHLCIGNDDKAASWCFEHIRKPQTDHVLFPGASLYQRLTRDESVDRCGPALIPADEFDKRLDLPSDPSWRTDVERFGEGGARNEIGARWWNSGQKMLPWLQRNYLRCAFPGYAPLAMHEDDLPYDVDHICPKNDWGSDWRTVRSRLESVGDLPEKRMAACRVMLGNGIGNLRLIESSTNKHDQDADVAKKMPFVRCDDAPEARDAEAMANWAFAPQHRALWRQVSCPGPTSDRKWSENRLAAFQRAVEQRAAWLYRCFHEDLGYASWTTGRSATNNSE